jgi:hypothetical protein
MQYLHTLTKTPKIDKKEMEKIIKAMYNLMEPRFFDDYQSEKVSSPSERAKLVIQQLDKNHDDCLSEEEFISGCLADPLLRRLLDPPIVSINNEVEYIGMFFELEYKLFKNKTNIFSIFFIVYPSSE